jgi:hypothetical protein
MCYIENVNISISRVISCAVNGRGVIFGNLADIFFLATAFRQAVAQSWRTYGTWHSPLSQSFYFSLPDQRPYIPKAMYICWYIWLHRDCVWIIVATKINCEWQSVTQIGSGAKGWLGIYRWGVSLAVTGRILWIKPLTIFFSNRK